MTIHVGPSVDYGQTGTAATPPGAVAILPKVPHGRSNVALLRNERAALPAILQAIDGAKAVVNVEMFSLQADGGGAVLAKALAEKARQGVEVNLLIDSFGSMQFNPFSRHRKMIDALEAVGVNVVRTGTLTTKERVDHRKLITIDGSTLFVGGMNLAAKFREWHDVMVKLDGPVAAAGQAEFVKRWLEEGGRTSNSQVLSLARAARQRDRPTGARVELVGNKPGSDPALTRLYLDRINNARSRIWILSPYLGDKNIVAALARAAQRGVDVRVAVAAPEKPPFPGMVPLTRSFYPELYEAGVKLFERLEMSHGKVLIADDLAAIGSFNISRASAERHYEIAAASTDPRFRKQVELLVKTDFAGSRPVTAQAVSKPSVRLLALFRDVFDIEH